METPKITLVFYEYPAAMSDVFRWLADNRLELEPVEEQLGFYHFRVSKENEIIDLIPQLYIDDMSPKKADKLVLWGAFTHRQLELINEKTGGR